MWYSHRFTSRRKLHPCKERLHLPSLLVAAQGAAILRLEAFATIRRNHCDAVVFGNVPVESIRVVGLVVDQPGGEFVEEAGAV